MLMGNIVFIPAYIDKRKTFLTNWRITNQLIFFFISFIIQSDNGKRQKIIKHLNTQCSLIIELYFFGYSWSLISIPIHVFTICGYWKQTRQRVPQPCLYSRFIELHIKQRGRILISHNIKQNTCAIAGLAASHTLHT